MICMTQRQITSLISIVEQLDRAHATYRKANEDDDGTHIAALGIADAAHHLANLSRQLDDLQKDIGHPVKTFSAANDATHYKALGREWDGICDSRYAEAS